MKALYLFSVLLAAIPAAAETTTTPNWSGEYAPCDRHADLLSTGHLDLAVRISTANDVLAQQFERALEFWTEILDLDWHEVDSEACSIQLVDGTPSLFNWCICMSARSQLPDRPAFQGLIAFNPRFKLSKKEMFLDSVHEIGHVLGLAHNPDNSSVMSTFAADKSEWLDEADLDALAVRHRLRPGIFRNHARTPLQVTAPAWTSARGPA